MLGDEGIVRELNRWREGKPRGLWMFAEMAAFSADELFSLCRDVVGNKELFPSLTRSLRQEWMQYYGNHRLLRMQLFQALGVGEARGGAMIMVLDGLNWFSRADKQLVVETLGGIPAAEWEVSHRCVRRMVRVIERSHNQLLLSPAEVVSASDSEGLRLSLAFRFLAQVELMSWLHFGKYSSRLLFNATRSGKPDFQAIEQLVRLDKRVLEHPRVRWLLNEAPRGMRTLAAARVAKALTKKPLLMKRSKLIMRVSAFLSAVARAMSFDLTEPQLRELWSIVARYRREKYSEVDWPLGSEAASKGIQRDRLLMGGMLPPDIIS